ncbi:MAG: coproporphyrinogen dehydrogenase HemZ [Oscillospiraceae bacterium]|nr:coproporphyrinogen dehydrogenase HemZ [Oscillospiraceae bacterium]
MKVYLKGHDFEFATQQIYMCIFPNSHAEFVSECPREGDYIISELEECGGSIRVETQINLNGKRYVAEEETPVQEGVSGEDRKRACRRGIKLSFFKAASEIFPKAPAWGALTGIRPSKVAGKFIDSGLSREGAISAMNDEFFVSPDRAALAVDCTIRAKEISAKSRPRDFSLYVGIPFCASRCRYCSFVSHSIEKARGLVAPYLEMLSDEIRLLSEAADENNLSLRTVYIGGGTPTALSNEELAFVMRCIKENFDIENIDEYTVEGGRPDTLSRDKIQTIRDLGATRISVNPQTMNDEILSAMDRRHTAEDVIRAIRDVREIGGLSINADLIAGLPGDSFESFKSSVLRLLELETENVTVHTLAIKKGSTLSQEKYRLPDGVETEKMVDFAMDEILSRGYLPYYLYRQKYMSGNLENVGYSKPGFESDYNNYIMDELHTILSAGAGGVTKLIDAEKGRIERIFNPKYPYEYNVAKEKIQLTKEKIREFFNEGQE